MTTKRTIHKLCCGSKAMILQIDKAIRKSQIDVFIKNGYTVPENYLRSGIFYVKKGDLVATCAYGTTKVQVRFTNLVSEQEIDHFQSILETAIGVK